MKSGVSKAQANRAMRRQALREQLEGQGHVQHVNELLKQLEDLNTEMESVEYQRLAKVIDTKLKLIAKYLPDDKEMIDLNLGGSDTSIKKIEIEFV